MQTRPASTDVLEHIEASRGVTARHVVVDDPVVRIVDDGTFSVARHVVAVGTTLHVVFEATDLRTGRTRRLNGAVPVAAGC
jgi:hypothetical protein